MTKKTALPIRICALYCFTTVADSVGLREQLFSLCENNGIRGTLLIAHEGINGTVAGSDDAIDALIAELSDALDFTRAEVKYARAAEMPFHRLKVRLKKEIVTMGVEDLDPVHGTGTHLSPEEWNELLADPDTVVIDTRNDYEIALGTFDKAVDPETTTFRQFPEWAERHDNELRGKKLAMFCTGGIRCEKATAYMKSLGHDEVYHLKGGILAYLEQVPTEESRWQGDCFVFDERVAVGHGLATSDATLCRACRHPLTEKDRTGPHYEEGVSCRYCYEDRTEADRARYRQRHEQMKLAEKTGRKHIGR
ncbi:rhodanese-related sulfurtransferase [Notoacmeibacter ruber]|uniref:tRNA uridine(34) hydroxylase n=1 Tax=Notoacmeibacter ruber TaxID=2670375 RepID=A0A3L7JCR3_9HYPH|nr:rhodanese-related sulfurtransferase [Notoacmeibacter ruber]RLQ88456.1 rhodanese-related sulfurtransferase [Notoacmeibacter ruber]